MNSFFSQAQGSLEYLLIIGGGILVAVVIIASVIQLGSTGVGGSQINLAGQTCNTFTTQSLCESAQFASVSPTADCSTGNFGLNDCCWDQTKTPGKRCSLNPTASVGDGSQSGCADIGACLPVACQIAVNCIAGQCIYENTEQYSQDAQCNNTIGCTQPPCECDGAGACVMDTTLSSCGYGYWVSGRTYTLVNDVITTNQSYCFNINAPNVTLNCGGKKITNASASDNVYVIWLISSNTKIQNCTIAIGGENNLSTGISTTYGSGGHTIINNTFTTLNPVAVGINLSTGGNLIGGSIGEPTKVNNFCAWGNGSAISTNSIQNGFVGNSCNLGKCNALPSSLVCVVNNNCYFGCDT
ncbi:MAG: hypothetical protein V1777_05050 [Candidatus Micrarchaeota archaeon]